MSTLGDQSSQPFPQVPTAEFESEHGGGDVGDTERVFGGGQRASGEEDYEALVHAVLEQMPTSLRMRNATRPFDELREGVLLKDGKPVLIDVAKLGKTERLRVVEAALQTETGDNYALLKGLRERLDRVSLQLPSIEVRFEDVSVSARVYAGKRALPSLPNSVLNVIEAMLTGLGILRSRKKELQILDNVSGVLKPGRLTLLLGPPSSGKTTLLRALTGKLDSSLTTGGRITYNGHTFDQFVAERTGAYISQLDEHMGELTVRETFDFAARCHGVNLRKAIVEELSRLETRNRVLPDPTSDAFVKAAAVVGREHSVVTDYILKILGLEYCADTVVGNAMIRGISGGQKKRVTTGEMLIGPYKFLAMDEVSTGLDSSTTFQIVTCVRNMVHYADYTCVMALLQPSPETFDLFDDVVLLSEGHIVYQGPRESILDYFEFMGFRCPERKGIADFLQEVTSRKDQQQYWLDKNKPYTFVPVPAFSEAFKDFELGQQVARALSTPYVDTKASHMALVRHREVLTPVQMLRACMKREYILMRRNSFLYIFKTCQVAFMAFITSTLFFRTTLSPTSMEDGNYYLSVLFYSLIIMMFNGLPEMSLLVARLPVFYKQRDNLFYPAWAFTIPSAILRIPFSAVESVIWSCLLYYTVGLAPEVSRFFTFFLLLFLIHQMAIGLFRLIGAVSRTAIITNTFGMFVLTSLFLLGGFIIPRGRIQPWWVWCYWISPLSYTQTALGANEFNAPRWNVPYIDSDGVLTNETLGQAILRVRGLDTEMWWVWLCVGLLIGYAILFNILLTLALQYLPAVGKPQAIIPEDILAEKVANRGASPCMKRESSTSTSVPSTGLSDDLEGGRTAAAGSTTTDSQPDSESPQQQHSHTAAPAVDCGVTAPAATTAADNGAGPESGRALPKALAGGAVPLKELAMTEQSVSRLAAARAERGMILPFQPLVMTFKSVNYYVDMPKGPTVQEGAKRPSQLQLLRNCSGVFRPGVLTALMGESGAGKTTLMDVLSGRKTVGVSDGEVCISGHPKEHSSFARISGYVEQFDVHSPQATVLEALQFSAWLRLPNDIDSTTRAMFIHEVMELVELTPLANALVGLPGTSGLSVEQRKRLTIAVELVSNPSIIFMDEPTSGLDARAAAIVMRAVRNTVNTGRTVVCTIHQPSIDVFESFDELVLMKRGGRIIYSGPVGTNSEKLIQYFTSVPGVPPRRKGYNPASWMLEVTNASSELALKTDFADEFETSELFSQNLALVEELSQPTPGSSPIQFVGDFSQPSWVQLQACLLKNSQMWWRNPQYNAIRYFYTAIVGAIFGTIFWQIGKKHSTQAEVLTIMGALYSAALFLGVSNASSIQPVVAVERSVFYREKAARYYGPLPWALAQGLIEVPYFLVQSFLYATITFAFLGFEWTAAKYLWYLLFITLSLSYFTYYGMMAVAICPSLALSSVISSAFYSIWNLFAGFLIPQPAMPGWWKWYSYLDPIYWSLYGLITSQLGDVDSPIVIPGGNPPMQPINEYLKNFLGYKFSFLPYVAVIMLGFSVVLLSVDLLAYRFLNFQKR